ncbi:MAG: hypothetical protein M1361_02510, partial [Patescibacteria group bacterium]|nr:hypothetical protein [Patescibacteria group bacterium]
FLETSAEHSVHYKQAGDKKLNSAFRGKTREIGYTVQKWREQEQVYDRLDYTSHYPEGITQCNQQFVF